MNPQLLLRSAAIVVVAGACSCASTRASMRLNGTEATYVPSLVDDLPPFDDAIYKPKESLKEVTISKADYEDGKKQTIVACAPGIHEKAVFVLLNQVLDLSKKQMAPGESNLGNFPIEGGKKLRNMAFGCSEKGFGLFGANDVVIKADFLLVNGSISNLNIPSGGTANAIFAIFGMNRSTGDAILTQSHFVIKAGTFGLSADFKEGSIAAANLKRYLPTTDADAFSFGIIYSPGVVGGVLPDTTEVFLSKDHQKGIWLGGGSMYDFVNIANFSVVP